MWLLWPKRSAKSWEMSRAKPHPDEHVRAPVAVWSHIIHMPYHIMPIPLCHFTYNPFSLNLQYLFHPHFLLLSCLLFHLQSKAIKRALSPICAHVPAFPLTLSELAVRPSEVKQHSALAYSSSLCQGFFPLYWIIPISTQTCWIFSHLNEQKETKPHPTSVSSALYHSAAPPHSKTPWKTFALAVLIPLSTATLSFPLHLRIYFSSHKSFSLKCQDHFKVLSTYCSFAWCILS